MPGHKIPEISIVIPVYNEEKILGHEVNEILRHMRKKRTHFEIILCENGSQDRTPEIARRISLKNPEIRVIHLDRPDYGKALKVGFLSAKGRYLFNFSMDFYDFGFLERALILLKEFDIVAGSKQLDKSDKRPILRRVISMGFYLIFRYVFGCKTMDTHGIKGFRREKIMGLVKRCKSARALFDTELILRAEKSGLRIKEIPVEIVEKRPARLSTIKQVIRAAFDMVSLKIILENER